MISKEIIERIEARHGHKLHYNNDCNALSEHIFEVTGERLSVSTLKRMFGFVSLEVEPRKSTMDIIAQFIGYPNYELLINDIGKDTKISQFSDIEEVITSDLKEGSQIKITYDPNRILILTYLGNEYFIVNKSLNSKLCKGDKIRVSHFVKGFELIVSDVIRDNTSIGSYRAAKSGGLTSIEFFG